MIRFSKYNIFSKIKDSENHFIVNLLTGNADILDAAEAERLKMTREDKVLSDSAFSRDLFEKGYLSDEAEERKLYTNRYLDFLDSREKDEVQVFFITNYSCNFACTYCYQDQYSNPDRELNPVIIDSFFSYIKTRFAGRKKYITIFGGEPLLSGSKQKKLIASMLAKATDEKLDVCIVTNGYTLEEYLPILQTGKIREIQVTLDGTAQIHDGRRFLKGGGGTFEKIVKGIDACLSAGINVNLRMVTDRENIEDLPALAQFAIDKGWTDSPFFKTQIGRNYELHHCQSASDKLFGRISLYERIHELTSMYPQILRFYKPAYSISKFLSENGELPGPLFDSCPACKTEWAFDYTGHIYPCTATVGKADESLGTFYPSVTLNGDQSGQWEARDVTSIPECRDCSVQLACGGGCGSVAKNKTGKICSSDCRPVKELLEIGFASYFGKDQI